MEDNFEAADNTLSEQNCVIPFQTPLSLLVAGASYSGKSWLVADLIRNKAKMFNPEPVEIMYAYGVWTPLYDDLEKSVPNIRFINRIPSKDEVDEFTRDNQPRLLIIDDLMTQLGNSPDVTEYFTVYVHHKALSCILLLQNLFYQGAKCLRDISLNVQGMFLFKNMRSPQQIGILATQMSVGSSRRRFFLDAYQKACSKQYGYLYVDINKRNLEKYQLRTDILPHQITKVFLPTGGA